MAELSLADKIAANKSTNGAMLPPAQSGGLLPPEAFIPPPAAVPQVPAAQPVAPTAPALPEGWTLGPNGVAVPPLPEGWRYSAAGVPELIPVQVAAPAATFETSGVVFVDPVPEMFESVPEPAPKRRGRPKKDKSESPEANGGLSYVPAPHFDSEPDMVDVKVSTVALDAVKRAADSLCSTLTDRDYFAMSALSGLCANPARLQEDNVGYAYDLADAMLEARSVGK